TVVSSRNSRRSANVGNATNGTGSQQAGTVESADAPAEVPSPPSAAYTPAANGVVQDRASYFIGNTIANLRGLDPYIPCGRMLTLIDGRRLAPGESPP